jgi:anti-sigma factor RsiW
MTMTPSFRATECRDIRAWLDSYLSGELLVETTEAVETHLGRCPTCRAEFDRCRRLRERVREACAIEQDTSELAARIEAGLAAAPAGWRRWTGRVAAVAAVLLVSTLVWRVALQPGVTGTDADPSGAAVTQAAGAPVIDALAARLIDASIYVDAVMSHTYCALTRALSAPPTEPARALAQLESYSGLVAAVAADLRDYTILDGHICPNGSRQFAHLVVERKGERASVLVTAKQDGDLPPGDGLMTAVGAGADVHIRKEGHFAIAAVESDRYAGFIVQDADQLSPTFPTPAVARDLAGYLKQIGELKR